MEEKKELNKNEKKIHNSQKVNTCYEDIDDYIFKNEFIKFHSEK